MRPNPPIQPPDLPESRPESPNPGRRLPGQPQAPGFLPAEQWGYIQSFQCRDGSGEDGDLWLLQGTVVRDGFEGWHLPRLLLAG